MHKSLLLSLIKEKINLSVRLESLVSSTEQNSVNIEEIKALVKQIVSVENTISFLEEEKSKELFRR